MDALSHTALFLAVTIILTNTWVMILLTDYSSAADCYGQGVVPNPSFAKNICGSGILAV